MSTTNDVESRFWSVLEKGRLADLSQFHRPNFYDEVPLYSRLSAISFLSGETLAEKNRILLQCSLKFLRAIISYEEHRSPYFAAITIWNHSPDNPIVPNLFVWSESVQMLYEKLSLGEVRTPFGKGIKRLASRPRMPESFEILEDRSSAADVSRVFIGPMFPPYPNFVPLHMFHKPSVVKSLG